MVGIAAAVALAVVIAGVSFGGRGDAGSPPAAQDLPEGHPTVTADGGRAGAEPEPAASALRTIAALERATDADPQDTGVLLELGDAYFLAQRYRDAARAYRRALALVPNDAAATVKLALVWHADGDSERAVAAITEVLAREPGHQEARYSLAIVYFSQGRTDDAREEWVTAAQIDPGSEIGRRSQSFVDLLDDQRSPEPDGG
jgi:cytochrome c-type biogenesis protein CcmH/NrfG